MTHTDWGRVTTCPRCGAAVQWQGEPRFPGAGYFVDVEGVFAARPHRCKNHDPFEGRRPPPPRTRR